MSWAILHDISNSCAFILALGIGDLGVCTCFYFKSNRDGPFCLTFPKGVAQDL